MNGETLELESGDKITVAHEEGSSKDAPRRVTITAQGAGLVAVAHLTAAEAGCFGSHVFGMAEHVEPGSCNVGEIPETAEIAALEKQIETMKAEHETAIATLVAELEAAKANACGHAPDA